MTDYQELYELERKRADICEGQILELRRQVAALKMEVEKIDSDKRHFLKRLHEECDMRRKLQLEIRKLRKIQKAASVTPEADAS